MRYYLLCTVFILLSCKTSKPIIDQTEPDDEIDGCILNQLPKTIGYEDQIENYTSIYKDTIFEIESTKKGMYEYSTQIDLKPSERYLWLLRDSGQDVDSLLIHCISISKSVDSYFIVDNCEIEIETTEYDDNGNPIVSGTKTIKI